jgi:hypothetical protein
MHQYKEFSRWKRHTSSWRWTLEFETWRRHQKFKN